LVAGARHSPGAVQGGSGSVALDIEEAPLTSRQARTIGNFQRCSKPSIAPEGELDRWEAGPLTAPILTARSLGIWFAGFFPG